MYVFLNSKQNLRKTNSSFKILISTIYFSWTERFDVQYKHTIKSNKISIFTFSLYDMPLNLDIAFLLSVSIVSEVCFKIGGIPVSHFYPMLGLRQRGRKSKPNWENY